MTEMPDENPECKGLKVPYVEMHTWVNAQTVRSRMDQNDPSYKKADWEIYKNLPFLYDEADGWDNR